MGLKELTNKQLKNAKTVISGMEYYGITEENISTISKINELERKIYELTEIVDHLTRELSRRSVNDIERVISEQFETIEGYK